MPFGGIIPATWTMKGTTPFGTLCVIDERASKMKNALTVVTAIPTSIGLVLVEHPVLAGLIGGWFIYKSLKKLKRKHCSGRW